MSAAPPSSIAATPAPPLRVYVAFEGGGAKGFAHVGALKALESAGLDIRGLAGTSAGAVVAVLKAAGYDADALVNPDTRTHLLDQLAAQGRPVGDATQFFEATGWRRIARLQAAQRAIGRVTGGVGPFGALFLAALVVAASVGVAALCGPISAGVAALVWLAAGSVVVWGLLRGLASAHVFRDVLDAALQLKLRGHASGRRITFRQFDALGGCPLKIVATDVTAGCLRLFSADDTPDVAVADAVTASICLPVIFAIWRIDLRNGAAPHAFLDGGLVSNLPVWPFDEERAIDPRAITIAVEIVDAKEDRPSTITRVGWVAAALRASIFGSAVLNKRAIGRLETIALSPDVGVLQFDLSRDEVFRIVENARLGANAVLVKRLVNDPAALAEGAAAARALAEAEFALWPNLAGPPAGGAPTRVRASIAMPENDRTQTLKLSPCAGFGADAEEEMTLPIQGSFVGQAWLRGEAFFQTVPFAEEFSLPGPANDLRRRLIWTEMTWSFSIPIFAQLGPRRGKVALIVAIDGNHTLSAGSPELVNLLQALARAVQRHFVENASDLGS